MLSWVESDTWLPWQEDVWGQHYGGEIQLGWSHRPPCININSPLGFTHWGRDQMDAIFLTSFSNAFSGMKCISFSQDIPALVQLMVWHCPADKPLSEWMVISLLIHICVTRLPRVNYPFTLGLTHWGWVMHIRISKLTTIGSDNGLSADRH